MTDGLEKFDRRSAAVNNEPSHQVRSRAEQDEDRAIRTRTLTKPEFNTPSAGRAVLQRR